MFAALFFLLIGQQAASPKATQPPPATASSPKTLQNPVGISTAGTPTTVHVAEGHISYTLPQGLTAQPGLGEEALKQGKADGTEDEKKALGCVSVPLLAVEASENFRMVSMLELDGKCLGVDATKQPLGGIATSTLSESLKKMGGEGQLSEPQAYKLATQDAAAVRGMVRSEKLGVTFQALVACTTSAQKIVCWELMAFTSEKVDALAAQPTQIDSAAPAAVIPAAVLKALTIAAAQKP